jgi:uncharacterized repeat protein (TIGR03847 family)
VNTRRLDLGLVDDVDAESFGEPGQRTFRLHAQTAEGSVSLWLEKEQVAMLGSAIEELLDRVPDEYGLQPASAGSRAFVGDLEVKVGSLAIGYDPDHAAFSVEAGEFTSPFDLESISFLASRDHFSRMRDQIDQIVAASRPRCILCGRPLSGEPHFCPESNGHARTSQSSS